MMQHNSQQAIEQLLTIRDWIRFGVSWLNQSQAHFGQGTDNAQDDSIFLVLGTLSLPLDELDPYLDARLLQTEREQLFEAFRRRCIEREPTAYILGQTWLQGLSFRVSPDVLIPRSPISELIAQGLEPWLEISPTQILEACTGSGCLAILAALTFEEANVVATDISPKALEVAALNVADYELQDRISLVKTDLLQDIAPDPVFDLIICNPPYVNTQSMRALPKEFLHEPDLALAGGTEGMDLVIPLLEQVGTRLKSDGWLLLEIGNEQAYFEAMFPKLNPIWLQTANADNQIMLLSAKQLQDVTAITPNRTV